MHTSLYSYIDYYCNYNSYMREMMRKFFLIKINMIYEKRGEKSINIAIALNNVTVKEKKIPKHSNEL